MGALVGLTGALALCSVGWRREDRSERRFCLRLRICIVGLPWRANEEYEPFHVDLLVVVVV